VHETVLHRKSNYATVTIRQSLTTSVLLLLSSLQPLLLLQLFFHCEEPHGNKWQEDVMGHMQLLAADADVDEYKSDKLNAAKVCVHCLAHKHHISFRIQL
jgi:hypothetical protein